MHGTRAEKKNKIGNFRGQMVLNQDIQLCWYALHQFTTHSNDVCVCVVCIVHAWLWKPNEDFVEVFRKVGGMCTRVTRCLCKTQFLMYINIVQIDMRTPLPASLTHILIIFEIGPYISVLLWRDLSEHVECAQQQCRPIQWIGLNQWAFVYVCECVCRRYSKTVYWYVANIVVSSEFISTFHALSPSKCSGLVLLINEWGGACRPKFSPFLVLGILPTISICFCHNLDFVVVDIFFFYVSLYPGSDYVNMLDCHIIRVNSCVVKRPNNRRL